ncbi:MAG: hypothetical protein A2X23_03635 [Chloroflexi bacterium GWC2_73_18]|nr:MAG: hypothetical protein A2X23_03635 [Chloroflexi bacterium GWC2_73_18]
MSEPFDREVPLEPTAEAVPAEPASTEPDVPAGDSAVAPSEPVSAPSEPVIPPPQALAPRAGRGVLRWAIAAFLTVAVAGVAVGGYLALQAAGQKPAAAAFLPADTLLYVQVTAEPTGDQHDKLLALLKRFPGFEDQSKLEQKIDETLDRLLRQANVDYLNDVKPWLGSTAALAARWPGGSDPQAVQVAFLVASIDDARLRQLIADRAEKARAEGREVATETYRDVLITTVPTREGRTVAAAILDGQLVAASDVALAKQIIDVREAAAGTAASLAETKLFKDALARVPADRMGTLYVDTGRFLAAALEQAKSQPNASALPPFEISGEGALIGYLRAEDDGVLLDFSSVGTLEVTASGSPLPIPSPPAELGKDRASRLDKAIPAGALLSLDIHDLGPALRYAIQAAKESQPELEESLKQIEQGLGLMGTSMDGLLGLFGDAALVVAPHGTNPDGGLLVNPDGGLLVEVTDAAAAERLIAQIDALLAMGGVGGVKTEEYRGVTLHQIDLSAIGMEGLPAVTPTYGVSGGLLIVSLDTGFAHAVVDVQNGADALAAQESYKAVLARVGAENSGAIFVDIQGLIGFIRASGAQIPDDVAAYLEPVSAFGFAASGGGDPAKAHARFFVLVK